MRLLADTHVLIWASDRPDLLRAETRTLLTDPAHSPTFSSASIWEIAIKTSRRRPDFDIEPSVLAARLREHGWTEIPIDSRHAARVAHLPPIHADPFDRILVAQALVEDCMLLTRDRLLLDYPGSIRPA